MAQVAIKSRCYNLLLVLQSVNAAKHVQLLPVTFLGILVLCSAETTLLLTACAGQ